jgi:2-polyprenyl-3-methyl-5-hydroxy-6-metoxy-1,4-benzoquinol methylase
VTKFIEAVATWKAQMYPDTKQTEGAVFEQQATLESWDRDYYSPIAERYYDQAVSMMLRLMEVEPRAMVLDAGCGPGVHSVRVARAGFRVCAIDISRTMLQEAKARIATAGVGRAVEFRQEDLTRLTFPDASFRYVFSWGVIIHIHDVEKALDELARVIEPGGKLALYVTNNKSWDQKLETLFRLVLRKPQMGRESLRFGSGIWYEMNGQRLWVWQFNIRELERQLKARGLNLTHRVIGEFSEIQRRLGGPLRRMLLRLNNLCYRLKFPPGPAVTNLLVFRKDDGHLLSSGTSRN